MKIGKHTINSAFWDAWFEFLAFAMLAWATWREDFYSALFWAAMFLGSVIDNGVRRIVAAIRRGDDLTAATTDAIRRKAS